jgi:solute:Na+ symporter, SSS family
MPRPPIHILAAFGPIDWAILAAYMATMLLIGLAAAWREKRHKSDMEEFFLGGRSMPTWALAISIVGSSLSAATFIGVPDIAYQSNVTYLILNAGGFIAVAIVGFVFVPRLYRAGTVTIYGYLEQRFGETARIAVSVVFLFGRMIASAVRVMLAALPLCLLIYGVGEPTDAQMVIAVIAVGFIGTFYTTFGGIKAVIWVDVIQFALVIGAAVLTIFLLLDRIPAPLTDIVRLLNTPGTAPDGGPKLRLVDWSLDPTRSFTVWTSLFGNMFVYMAAFGVDQDLAQRFLVARSPAKGAIAVIAQQFISLATVSMFVAIGLLLFVFYKRPDMMGSLAPDYAPGQNQGAYAQFLLKELPTVLSGLAIVGLFAVAQGSMDSAINALASSAVSDVYFPLRRRLGRRADVHTPTEAPKFAVAFVGAIMTLAAIGFVFVYDPADRTFIDFALGVMTFAFSGMLGVFLTGLLTRRGNSASVLAALVAGVITIALLQDGVLAWWTKTIFGTPYRLAWPWWMPIGTAASFLVCVLGPPRQPSEPRGFPVEIHR